MVILVLYNWKIITDVYLGTLQDSGSNTIYCSFWSFDLYNSNLIENQKLFHLLNNQILMLKTQKSGRQRH